MDLLAVETLDAAGPEALEHWREGDAWLAGGTWLFSEPQRELRRLHDLTALGWEPLRAGPDGLEVAATCTLAQLAAWPGEAAWPASALVAQCCRALLGSFKIWNVATVGGNLCLALPAGPMVSLAAALDGVCTIWGAGGASRELGVSEFVRGPSRNALAPGELLRSVTLPAAALRGATAFRQFSLSPVGRSAAVVIGRRPPAADGLVLTLTAAVPRPLRLEFSPAPEPDELEAAIIDAVAGDWYDAVHGDPAWREHLALALAEEVRAELAGEGA